MAITNNRKATAALVAALTTTTAAAPLGGCGSMNGLSGNPETMMVVTVNPDGPTRGMLTQRQRAKIVDYAKVCYKQLKPQLAGVGETVFVNAVTYGIAGALGLAGGSQSFPGADPLQYAGYGAASSAANSVPYSLNVHSNAVAALVGGCVREFVDDNLATDVDFVGVHVAPSYIRATGIPDSMVVPDNTAPSQPSTPPSAPAAHERDYYGS